MSSLVRTENIHDYVLLRFAYNKRIHKNESTGIFGITISKFQK